MYLYFTVSFSCISLRWYFLRLWNCSKTIIFTIIITISTPGDRRDTRRSVVTIIDNIYNAYVFPLPLSVKTEITRIWKREFAQIPSQLTAFKCVDTHNWRTVSTRRDRKMHYNYYRYGTIHGTYTIYTLQSPQTKREDTYHHKHRFLHMFTPCHVFTNTEYLYRQTAAVSAFVGIIAYTYHLSTMNYIVFTR